MEMCLIQCSCPLEQAELLANLLIDQRLAACVQIAAVRSVYRWQDTIHSDREGLLLIKTAAHRFAEVRDCLLAHHPYEIPEILCLPVIAGHQPYLDWAAAACQKQATD